MWGSIGGFIFKPLQKRIDLKMALETIIWASFILAVGLFSALGFFVNFEGKIKDYLKNEENSIEDMSKMMAEEIVNNEEVVNNLPKDRNQRIEYFTGFSKKLLQRQLDIVKKREITREPSVWLSDLRKGICLSILLFLASGTLGLSIYNAYAPPIFAVGVSCFVYGIYKFYQIADRTKP